VTSGTDLEAFRVPWHSSATENGAAHGIDHSQAAASITHDEIAACRIEPDIVGIVAKRYHAGGRQTGAMEQMHRSVSAICNRQNIEGGRIPHPLRLLQPVDPLNNLSCLQVDHVQRSVAQLGDE
jgi:hypothetical protein